MIRRPIFTAEMNSRVLRGRNSSAERDRKHSSGERQRIRGPRCWLQFDLHGGHRLIVADKHRIMRMASVPARDLRILEPASNTPASILIREEALVVNLERFRFILCAEQVLLWVPGEKWEQDPWLKQFVEDLTSKLAFSPSDGELPASAKSYDNLETLGGDKIDTPDTPSFLVDKARGFGREASRSIVAPRPGITQHFNTVPNSKNNLARRASVRDSGYSSDGGEEEDVMSRFQTMSTISPVRRAQNYFEFKVLEVALENICNSLEHDLEELEELAYPALDDLSQKVTSRGLETVRGLKVNLNVLTRRNGQMREELQHILDDDDDMAQMYLTRKMVSEGSPKKKGRVPKVGELDHLSSVMTSSPDIEELEDLLEAFHEQTQGMHHRLETLSKYIDDTEDYVNIKQDSHRNKLIQIELVLTAISIAITMLSTAASVFGMNVPSGLEEDDKAFLYISSFTSVVGFGMFSAFIGFCRYQQLL